MRMAVADSAFQDLHILYHFNVVFRLLVGLLRWETQCRPVNYLLCLQHNGITKGAQKENGDPSHSLKYAAQWGVNVLN